MFHSMRLFNPGAITTEWSNQLTTKVLSGDGKKEPSSGGHEIIYVCLFDVVSTGQPFGSLCLNL